MQSSLESSDDSSILSLRWWTGFFPAGLCLHLAPGLFQQVLWMWPCSSGTPTTNCIFQMSFHTCGQLYHNRNKCQPGELRPVPFPSVGGVTQCILLGYEAPFCWAISLAFFAAVSSPRAISMAEVRVSFSASNFCWILLLLIPQISLHNMY